MTALVHQILYWAGAFAVGVNAPLTALLAVALWKGARSPVQPQTATQAAPDCPEDFLTPPQPAPPRAAPCVDCRGSYTYEFPAGQVAAYQLHLAYECPVTTALLEGNPPDT